MSERARRQGGNVPAIVVLLVFGLGFAAFGLSNLASGLRYGRATAHDPSCVTELTISVPPRSGASCRIVAGTIERASESSDYDRKGNLRITYSLEFAHDGARDDIELGSRDWPAYDAATKRPGTPALAEWIAGRPEFVATADGTIGPIDPPDEDVISGILFTLLGAFFLTLLGLGIRRSRARRFSSP